MFKRILTFTGLFFSLLFMVSSSWAAEVSIYDANFERLRGNPTPYEVEFSANEGRGRLILLNGTPEGDFRVSSATISLNGTVIVDSDKFNQNISELEVDIPLGDHNALIVQLVSAPESFIDIAVKQVADAVSLVNNNEGGKIEVVDGNSPLKGVSLEISPGALATEAALISIEAAEIAPEAPERGTLAGQVIELKPDGLQFEKAVILTLIYNDVNNDGIVDGTSIDEEFVSVGYFNEVTQLWEQLKVVSRDFLLNTVSAEIEHFSIYSPFVRDGNVIPQETQWPPANILIDGVPGDSEWDGTDINGKPVLPTMSEADPSDDSLCGSGTNIRHVYTAIDGSYAYIMIDMLDKVDPKANILLDIDMRIGKDHQQASYADMSLYFNSEGGVSGGSFSGDIDFCCNDLSRCYIDCADQSAPPAYEIEFVRDEVLEAKIPLALLSNESGIPGYFNATEIKVRDGLNPNIICDVDEMYSKIPWFRFQKRIYADPDKKDRITFIFSKITRERKFLSDLNDIEYIYLYRPDGTQIDLKQEGGIEPVNTISAWGFYNGYHNNFLIDPYMDETYLIKNYLEGETSEALQLGTYLLEVKDNIGGHVYEDDFILKRTTDIPTVDSNTVQCHIHDESEYPRESPLFNDRGIDLLDGDLYCDWKYPEYDFVNDIEEKIQVHPHISAYKGGSTLRYVYPASMLRIVDEYSPRYNDEIIDFVIVPKADLKTLICGDDVDPDAVVGTEDADEVKISIRTRVRSGSVRSYSAKKLIDIPAGFCN